MTVKERIDVLRDIIETADAVIAGGASGMSAASGCKFSYQDNAAFRSVIKTAVRNSVHCWAGLLRERAAVSLPDSRPLHATAHAERVLSDALRIGVRVYFNHGRTLESLAHAACFHDTGRRNELCDSKPGARAAVPAKDFCQRTSLKRNAEASVLMHFHHSDHERGYKAVAGRFGHDAPYILGLYAVFKDAAALDKRRLGANGLGTAHLRHPEARVCMNFSRRLADMNQRSEP